MSPQPGFEIREASLEDMEELWHVLMSAYGSDEVWVSIFKSVKAEEVHPWIMANLNPRWTMPDIKNYKVVELSTGKIVAWTGLEYPWKYVAEMSRELKAEVLDDSHMPSAVEGMNMDALLQLLISISNSKNHGWNPEEDYHRKATMVLPEYQKRGFATALTKHCNTIADKSGDRTWVSARPTSVKMFRDNGFVDVGTVDAHLERWGGSREKSTTWILVRAAPSAWVEENGLGQET